MAENDPAPNAQPNTAPQANATPAAGINPDTLVDIKVDGRTLKEPWSKVVQGYQIASAAQKRLTEANELKQRYSGLMELHQGDIEFAQNLRERLAKDPEGALKELQNQVSMSLGRPVGGVDAHSEANDGSESGGANQRLLAELRAMKQEIAEFKRDRTTDRVTGEITRELDAYPLFRNDEDARANAELFLTAYRASNPRVPLSEAASEVHARMQRTLERTATASKDQRIERQQTLAGVPAGTGTPAMSEPPAQPTYADFKSGKWRQNLDAYLSTLRARGR